MEGAGEIHQDVASDGTSFMILDQAKELSPQLSAFKVVMSLSSQLFSIGNSKILTRISYDVRLVINIDNN